jgi:hypothetical protein
MQMLEPSSFQLNGSLWTDVILAMFGYAAKAVISRNCVFECFEFNATVPATRSHGATSVGEFQSQGFLAPAMVNYLSLLGWNDGTEQEIFKVLDCLIANHSC